MPSLIDLSDLTSSFPHFPIEYLSEDATKNIFHVT